MAKQKQGTNLSHTNISANKPNNKSGKAKGSANNISSLNTLTEDDDVGVLRAIVIADRLVTY